MSGPSRVSLVEGTGLPLRGDDIDTDRIIPARYLRAISFEGMECHLFEDDRAQDGSHPFSNPAYRGAALLVVNRNFGCGSSREHAPQAIQRWGIGAVVGESFSEIFLGNSAAIGMPCVALDHEAVAELQAAIEKVPSTAVRVDVAAATVAAGPRRWPARIPPALQEAFVTGAWDATGLLLERFDDVRAVAGRLPYVSGFRD
jgi:3-isopropylmalate/(R)-2-methylmalate dehydratase small subunit